MGGRAAGKRTAIKALSLEKNSDNVERQIDEADDENSGRFQFMANFNTNRGILGPSFADSDDEAVYLDSLSIMQGNCDFPIPTYAMCNEVNQMILEKARCRHARSTAAKKKIADNNKIYNSLCPDHESTSAVTRATTSLCRSPQKQSTDQVQFSAPRPVLRKVNSRLSGSERRTSLPPPLSPTVIPATRRQKPSNRGDMYMDPLDPIQIPQTFPIQDIGEITPWTTDIDELPPGFPPPPQQTQSRTPTHSIPIEASDTKSEGQAPKKFGVD